MGNRELLNRIIERLKLNFYFLTLVGYDIHPVETFNQNDDKNIFGKLTLKSSELKRSVVFIIEFEDDITLQILLVNDITNESMDYRKYLEFKKGNPPQYYPQFELNSLSLINSVDQISIEVKASIETDLKQIVLGNDWITLPTYDLRDGY